MWCKDSSYFKGKYSTGATPQLTPIKSNPKPPKRPEIQTKKSKIFSERVTKKKNIVKKSVFFKSRNLPEFVNLPLLDVSSINVEEFNSEFKTPSPKKKSLLNKYNSMSLNLKKSRKLEPGKAYDFDTTDTTDYIEEDQNFLRGNPQNSSISSNITPQKLREFSMNTSGISSRKSSMNSSKKSSRNSIEKSRFINDYEVLEIIGNGFFGTVYKCLNRIDGLIYAVKCTKSNLNCNFLYFSSHLFTFCSLKH